MNARPGSIRAMLAAPGCGPVPRTDLAKAYIGDYCCAWLLASVIAAISRPCGPIKSQ